MIKFPGKLRFVNLYYHDSKKAIEFFRDKVGLTPFIDQDENDDWYGFEPTSEGVAIAIEPLSNLRDRPFEYNRDNPTLLQFEIADDEEMEKAVADLIAQGVKFVREPTKTDYGLIANFVDPEGNVYELIVPSGE